MTTLFENTTAWRRETRATQIARRCAIDPATHAEWSARIAAHLDTHLATHQGPPPVIGFCWPIQGEPDARPLLYNWRAQGHQIALPVVMAESDLLQFRPLTVQSTLQPDRYGIPTPTEGDFVVPDLLLIPLNAFDAAGYRLGYGGGFFDRTLAQMAPRPRCIGLGFELNRLPSIHPEAHDQRLDEIVTEAGVFAPE